MKKIKKLLFKGPYFPSHDQNLMSSEGDLGAAREDFLKNRFTNVDFLLKSRYDWMNKYLKEGMKIVEVGAGSGLSELYLNQKPLITDAVDNPWVDKYIDATKMDFEDSSIDIIIASHTIHHFYNPAMFFFECERVLKKGGKIVISEIHTSFFMRLLLTAMRHEGYSYDIDIFNLKSVVNDKRDLWSANCAVPEILFESTKDFENYFTNLKIDLKEYCEFSIFPLSGGVTAKTPMPRLPIFILKCFNYLDKILVRLFPRIFALGMRVVISRK